MMQQVAGLADQVREHRRTVPPENPLRRMQSAYSDGIIAALDAWRDLRDRSLEQVFLLTYSSPILQSLVGLHASAGAPRRHPGIEPERLEFIQKRIAELQAGIAKGGSREAAIRGLVYIGMAGTGMDERAFEVLRHIRAEHSGFTLAQFKQVLREQYLSLMLDREGALAAIPVMLRTGSGSPEDMLAAIRRIVAATGAVTGERALRLQQVENLFRSPDLGQPPDVVRAASRRQT